MLSLRPLYAVALLALCLSACTKTTPQTKPDKPPTAVTAQCVAPTPDPSLPACGDDDEMCRVERLGSTQVGWLDQGTTIAQVKTRLGEPDSVTEPEEEGASGDIFQVFVWEKAGVEVDGRAVGPQGELAVHSFTVKAPFVGQTERCVGLGSSREQITAAYADVQDPNSQSSFIAGSIYGGMFFFFDEQGRVSSIFVGAGAE